MTETIEAGCREINEPVLDSEAVDLISDYGSKYRMHLQRKAMELVKRDFRHLIENYDIERVAQEPYTPFY